MYFCSCFKDMLSGLCGRVWSCPFINVVVLLIYSDPCYQTICCTPCGSVVPQEGSLGSQLTPPSHKWSYILKTIRIHDLKSKISLFHFEDKFTAPMKKASWVVPAWLHPISCGQTMINRFLRFFIFSFISVYS